MNTSKFLVAGLTAAMLSTAPALFARDTEAQKKANEALQQKLNELNSQPGAPAPAAPAPVPQKPVPVTAPAPAAAPVPAAVAVQATPTPPVPTPAPVVEPAPVTPIEDPAVVKAREDALNRAMGKSGGFSEVPPPSNTGNATPVQLQVAPTKASASANLSPKAPQPGEYKPLVAPPSPINAAKAAKLAELLEKYRADQITPDQYHAERAKILGTP